MSNTKSNGMMPFRGSHQPSIYLLILVAASLTFLALAAKSFWFDEVSSVLISRNWSDMWNRLTTQEANMWLYSNLLYVWTRVGEGEFFVRSLSAMAAILNVPAIYVLTKRLFGTRTAILAAILLVPNVTFIRYAQEARGYSLLFLLSTLSSYFFVKSIERPLWRNLIAYAVISVLAFYAHFFAVLVLVAHAVALLFLHWRQVPWRKLLVAALFSFALMLPVLLALRSAVGQIDWVSRPALGDITYFLTLISGGIPILPIVYFGLGVVAIRSAQPLSLRQTFRAWHYKVVILLFVLPIVIALAISFTVKPIFYYRYLLFTMIPLVMLAAAGLSHLRPRLLFAGTVALIIILSSIRDVYWYVVNTKDDWRGATAYITANAREGDAITFYSYPVWQCYDYYRQQLPLATLFPYKVELASKPYALGGGTRLPEPDQELILNLSKRFPRVWLAFNLVYDNTGRLEQMQLIQNLLAEDYSLIKDESFSGVEVLLYEVRARSMIRLEPGRTIPRS